jgi:uncharacterized protein
MGERTSYEPGTFCWVDLQTSDQDGAKAFYEALLGWETEDVPIGDGMVYTMARLRGLEVAALGPAQDPTMPPHWNCYVAVADADASATRAAELGAQVVAEPVDVFDAGRMAVIRDPQGAFVSVWQARDSIGARLVNEVGALSWNDLLTPDVDGSARFYGDLFGWRAQEAGEGYFTLYNGDAMNGGLMQAPPGQFPAWNAYFAVDDLDAALERVGDLGGGRVVEPMEVPAGRFAAVRDPQGAVFSLFSGRLDS